MSQREDLLEILKNSRAKIMLHLSEVDVNREVYPLWTIREMLAHLAGWDEAAIGYARALLAGQVPGTPAAAGIEAYNAASVAARSGLDYEQVRQEFEENRNTLLELIREMPEEKINAVHTLPWGSHGSLVDIVDIWGPHEEEHALDMEKLMAQSRGRV